MDDVIDEEVECMLRTEGAERATIVCICCRAWSLECKRVKYLWSVASQACVCVQCSVVFLTMALCMQASSMLREQARPAQKRLRQGPHVAGARRQSTSSHKAKKAEVQSTVAGWGEQLAGRTDSVAQMIAPLTQVRIDWPLAATRGAAARLT